MSITRLQFANEIRDRQWRFPDNRVFDLWGSEGKLKMPVAHLNKLINDTLIEWAKENHFDQQTWTLDDGSGGEGTLTAGQRNYTMAPDQSIVTEVYVNYDDDEGYRGQRLQMVNTRFLVADETDTSPDQDMPERIFIWKDVFELDPIPDDAYTMRFYGYQLPDDLTADDDIPTPLEYYHQSILRKLRVLVAESMGALDYADLKMIYEDSRAEDKRHDRRRHQSVKIVRSSGTGYW